MADTHEPHPQNAPGPSPRVTRREFANRVAVAGLIIIGLIILTLLLWYTIDVFLVAFAGILLAVLLRAMADAVSFITRLPKGWSLLLGGIVLIVGSVVFLWTLTPRLVVQLEQLHETLPAALEQLGQFIQRYEWGSIVYQEAKNIGGREDFRDAIPSLAAGAATALTATTTMIVGAVVAIFIGIFLAINPAIYVRGTVRLIPIASRPRAVEVLEATESSLRWWLIGRIIAMAFVGVVTAITLWLLGVPLSLSLGVLAGVLDFIPNVGPIIAAVPALIIAFGESPQTALYVLVA